MKAIVAQQFSGTAGLLYADVDEPAGPGRVVIEVAAAGVCFPDLLTVRGEYQWKPELPFIPGNEIAGVVSAAPASSGFAVGQRVSACPMLGGYAERVAVPPEYVVATPANVDDISAVCLLGNYYTAYFALMCRGRLRPGETVIVLGAAGGIGVAGVQVAKALGANVIAMVHRPDAVDFVSALGADTVLPLTDGWRAEVEAVARADLILDQIGGPTFDEALQLLTPGGRVLVLGFASGGGIPAVRVDHLHRRNVSVVGVNSSAFVDQTPGGRALLQSGIGSLVAQGLRPPPPLVMPLSAAPTALERLARGEVLGKVVLVP